MTYVLHGARGSGSCAVECMLAEIGADYELRELSLRDDEQRGEQYAAINPHRKVPSLVIDDGPPLTESVAILLTLDDRHPEAALLPAKGTPTRAQALRWLLFAATEIYPIVEINDYPERFATDPDRFDAMRERAREIWRARWLVVEANVAGDPYLSSDGFSLTDIYLAVVSRWAQQEHWRPASLPNVERLAAAVAARPAIAPVWARHFGPVRALRSGTRPPMTPYRSMPNIQIRNVPEVLHRILKAKAAIEGSSLSDFVRAELEQIAKRPTHGELRTRLRRRDPVHLSPTAADIIRDFRDCD